MNQEVIPPESNAAILLFVDDDASVLTLLKRLFQPLGYHILMAESGAEVLVLLEKDRVDLNTVRFGRSW
jgi:CheY-like chemotaxis protein